MWVAFAGLDDIVAELIAARATIDAVDEYGQTALMVAAWWGHAEIVSRLLRAGADPDRRDAVGKTAIDHALRNDKASIAEQIRCFRP